MKKGLFITVEGGDGSGKTTQLAFIRGFLEERGEDVLYTREPGGTPIGERIREIILDKDHPEMDAMTETLLYAASRAQIVSEVIKPALAAGRTVVCDRYVDSSIAYQGYGRELGESVAVINGYAVQDCMPDLTILLLVDPEEGRQRLADRPLDRLEQEGLTFHGKVYQGYQALAEQFPDRIRAIDGTMDVASVSREIAKALQEALDCRDDL